MIQDNKVLLKYLSDRGYEIKTDYYSYIDEWCSWYKNFVKKFHTYHDQYGTERQLYRLGMGKKLPEDWSSIIYTERDEVICGNTNNQEYLNKQFKDKKLNEVIATNIEKAFYSGTCATTFRIKNVIVENKELKGDDKTTYDMVNYTAEQIIPLKIENGVIIDVAFVSTTTIEKDSVYYIEIHTKEEGQYKIENIYIDANGKEVENKGIVKEIYTKSKYPLFSLLMPNINNNIDVNNGLGLSIYANAIDQLKACDLTYNNYVQDTELGGKTMFYNQSLVTYKTIEVDDGKGNITTKQIPIYPDELTRRRFQILGDEFSNATKDTLLQEYNPDLRVEDNKENVNMALNLLSFKTGLGKGFYKFEYGTITTATQYLGENKDLTDNAKKHRAKLNEYLVGLSRGILLIGRLIFGEALDENDDITLTDKDGFLISDEELRQQWKDDYNMGIMSKKEYMMKARGMSEEQAIKTLEEIKAEEPSYNEMFGGNE